MENGVKGIDAFQLDEGNHVASGSSMDKVEDTVAVGSSKSSKELEEEVFEEAFGDSQGEETKPVAAVGDSVLMLAVADEEIGARNDGEAFEEAVGVPAEVGVVEEVDDVIGEKVEGLLGGESVDETDAGGTTEKVETDELNPGKEVVVVDADEGPDVLKDRESVVSNRKFDVSEEAIIEDSDKEEVEGDRCGVGNQVTGELADALHDVQEDKHQDLNESMAEFHGEHQDRRLELQADGGVFDSRNGVRGSQDLRDGHATVDVEQQALSNGEDDEAPNVSSLEQHRGNTEIEDDLDAVNKSVGDLNVNLKVSNSPSPEKTGIEIDHPPLATLNSELRKPADSVSGTEKNDSMPNKPKMQAEVHQEVVKSTPAGERGMQFTPKAATSSRTSANSSSPLANSTPPPTRPAGLGRAAPLEPVQRAAQQTRVNGNVSHAQSQQIEDSNGDAEDYDETREKLQMIRVKFLRLAHRLGQTPHNVVVAQVLYRLGLAEQLRGRNGGRVGAFSFDRASAMAEQIEATGQEALDFSCTIMVLGKTGVGKSATINSIFDEVKFNTDAFQVSTKKVQDVVGTVQGIKVRVIDTPGLLPSWSDQRQNEKILHSVKRFIKKTPPDIVLYLDRLDMQCRDFSDMPLLRTISDIFGPSIWFNAIVVLTHAASAPPDGPNGSVSSYDMFVTQRSHVVQQAIRQAAGDMRLMNPVSLVENHSACRTNRAGQRVLPNGQVWKPHLLLLSFASKILSEANTLLKLQDSPPGKPFAPRSRAPPLPFLLSSLLQSRPQVKLPEEQFGDEDDLEDDLDVDLDSEDESEYDELPPFKSLTKAQVKNLTKAQKKAYFEEFEYREKLLMKKQLRDERRRRKLMKKMAAAAKDVPGEYSENVEEESGGAASVPVSMPDLALPASFDSDNPTHRYRCLDTSNPWLVRPVLETHGWDHDVGYEGINVERLFVVKDKVPVSLSGQVTKDKKDASVQVEIASSIKHGEGKATSLGFDMQTMGKDLAYTLRSETRFSNFRKNKATAGLSVTLLGDAVSAGVKVEDKLIASKRFQMVVSGGAMTGRGDVAYGGSLEAQLRDKDYPLGRSLSTLGLSVMDWHGDLAVGCNVQSQIPVGRSTNLIARANLNNRGTGQVSVRVNSSEQLQLALVGLLPLLKKLISYSQQIQHGQ